MASNYVFILGKMTPKEYESLKSMCNLINEAQADSKANWPKTSKGCHSLFADADNDEDEYVINWCSKKIYDDSYDDDPSFTVVDNYGEWLGKVMTAKHEHCEAIYCGDDKVEFNDDNTISVGCVNIPHSRIKRIYDKCFHKGK